MKASKKRAHRPFAACLALAALLVCSALPVSAATTVLVPQASGTAEYGNSSAKIDASNASKGYIMASYKGSVSKIKLQITGSDGNIYTYNLSNSGKYEVFPLTAGNGSYTINIFENVVGTSYALAFGKTISVTLESQQLPFLYPSQYVNFSSGSNAVKIGEQLAAGSADQLEIISRVYNYVITNITYDDAKAASIQSGQTTTYLPSVDATLSSGKGICFDYAAVMATMLRTQGIPTRLEVGYVTGGTYHAWISTYIDEVGWVNGVIQFNGVSWRLMDPTFASSGKGSESITQFINNSGNYATKFRY